MTGRLFSLIALPLTLVGHLLFWSGSAVLLRTAQLMGPLDVAAIAMAGFGILLIAAAVATVAIGSLGAIIVGAIHILFSLLLFLVPFAPMQGGFSPAFSLMNGLRDVSREVSDGMFFYVPTGIAFLTGVVFLCAGLAAHARRAVAPAPAVRVLSGVAGLLGAAGILLGLAGGARLYIAQLVMLAGLDPLGIGLLFIGAVLLAVAVLAARWSSAGSIVTGAIVGAAGLLALASPIVLRAAGGWSELRRGIEIAGATGSLLLIGLLLLVAGLAVRVRARRAAGLAGFAGTAPVAPVAADGELPPPAV